MEFNILLGTEGAWVLYGLTDIETNKTLVVEYLLVVYIHIRYDMGK